MKRTARTRIVSLVLALVMLLPMISIPTFAADTVHASVSDSFDGKTTEDVLSSGPNTAKVTTATKDAQEHGDVLQMDAFPSMEYDFYLYKSDSDIIPVDPSYDAEVRKGNLYLIEAFAGEIELINQRVATKWSDKDNAACKCNGYSVVTGEALDAARGGGNVMAPTTIKHAALSGEGDFIVVEMDMYLSADLSLNAGITGRIYTNQSNKRAELFKIGKSSEAGYATFEKHSDANYLSGQQAKKLLALDEWYTFTFYINRTSTLLTACVDGEYVFQSISDHTNKTGIYTLVGSDALPLTVKENSLQVEVTRLNGDPSVMKGYVQVDNASIRLQDVSEVSFSHDFEGATLDTETTTHMSLASITRATLDAEGHGDVVQIRTEPDASVPYYLWTDRNNKWPITGTVTDGKLTGTCSKGEITDAEIPAGDADLSKTYTIGDVKYKIVTGNYADMTAGMENYMQPIRFKQPCMDFGGDFYTISFDLYLSADFKSSGSCGFTGRLLVNDASGKEARAQLFQLYSDGNTNVVHMRQHGDSNIVGGSSASLERERWYQIDVVIDRKTTRQYVLVDGAFKFETMSNKSGQKPTSALLGTDAIPLVSRANELQFENARGTNAANVGGYVQLDNVTTTVGDAPAILYDFDLLDVGSTAHGMVKQSTSKPIENSSIQDNHGSNAWNIPSTGNDRAQYLPAPTLSYETGNTLVYEVDYFIEMDAKGQIQQQFQQLTANVGGTRETKNWLDLYQLKFENGTVTFKFENSVICEGFDFKTSTYEMSAGSWHNVALVIDLTDGYYDIYIDGNLIFESVPIYRAAKLSEIIVDCNKITIGKTNAVKVNGVVVEGAGSFQIDNIRLFAGTIPTAVAKGGDTETVLYSTARNAGVLASEENVEEDTDDTVSPYEEYVEHFDTRTLEDVAIVNGDTPITARVESAAVDTELHGSVVQLNMTSKAPALYYLWQDRGNKWAFTDYQINPDGTLSGISNYISVENAVINSDDFKSPVTVGEKTYYVVTGALAEANGGYLGNICQPLKIKNSALGAREGYFTLSMDFYLSSSFATRQGITGRISVLDASGKSKRLELFKITAADGLGIFDCHGNAVINEGRKTSISLNAWHTLTFVVDRETTVISAYLDGTFAFSAQNNAKNTLVGVAAIPLSVAPNTLEFEIARMNLPAELGGYFQVDNIRLYHGEADGTLEENAMQQDFEAVTLGGTPTTGVYSLGVSGSLVANEHGSKAWRIPLNEDNVGKTPRIAHRLYSYKKFESIVIAADYFIEKDAKGTLENRIRTMSAFVGDATAATRIGDGVGLYRFLFAGDGALTLAFEGAGESAADPKLNQTLSLSADTWIRVETVIDLVGGTYDLYVDGVLAVEDIPFYLGADRLTNLSVSANAAILGGVGAGAEGTEGAVHLDNVAVYAASEVRKPLATEPLSEDFEAYAERVEFYLRGADMPALARYKSFAGNTVVSLDLGPVRTDGWALLDVDCSSVFAFDVIWDPEEDDSYVVTPGDYFNSEEEFDVEFDEALGLYYAPIDMGYRNDPDIHNFYIVPNSVAESAFAGANVGRGVSLAHGIYSYKDTEKVVFTADYFLAKGSVGTVASTLEGFRYGNTETYGASLITLWAADAATGKLEGADASLKVGAWNRVLAVLDLKTGAYDLYVNDRFIYTRESGRTDLTIGKDATSQWNIAVSVPHASLTGVADGELLIDNVRVDTNVPTERSQYDDRFLTDEGYFAYLSDVLVSIDAASIRLEAPNGLRFATKIDEAILAEITERFTVKSMGTLITTADIAAAAGGATHALLNALEGDANYLDIAYQEDFDGAAGLSFEEGRYFTASVVNVKEKNLARDFVGVAYLTVAIDEETEITFYAKGFVANASMTASTALADENADWTDGEKAILEGFVVEAPEVTE